MEKTEMEAAEGGHIVLGLIRLQIVQIIQHSRRLSTIE